ncbi:probable calcium-binding protein CML25 [Euphorbia lathyris]|uniref:probable calcium-binding protein CML25 n=1 Tax=Euphorbia lathyris TaxID=212925 RepID=UPI003313D935
MSFKSIFNRKKSKKSDESPTAAPPLSGSRSHSLKIRPQIDELEQVFSKFDVNGDGKISSSELGSIMSSLGHQANDEELQNMIKEFDSDGDGFIDFQEFVELNTQGVDTDMVLENLKDAFSVYDIDGNGSISAEELQKVMGSIGEHCSIADCKKMINGVDSDGDGMIDFEEFKVMMTTGVRWDGVR